MFYVYVLWSKSHDRLYVGYSSELRNRFQQHNQGISKATKLFRPYELIYYEAFVEKKDAKNREVYLKSGWGRRSLKKMLPNWIKNNASTDRLEMILED